MAYEVISDTPDGHDMGVEHFDTEAEAFAYGEAQADEGLYVRVFEVDANGKRLSEVASFEPDYEGDDVYAWEHDDA